MILEVNVFSIEKSYEFIVVGGGLSGVCTALAAARHGVKTALIQNRSVLGGNSSSEMRVHINGAGRDNGFRGAIESGIILELLMANKKVNPQYSYSVWDNVLWEKVYFQDNLDLYLNTHMVSAKTEDDTITEIEAFQTTNETQYTFKAKYFADTTGDATLSHLSGADYIIGREGKDVYGESLAPDTTDKHTMGSTVLFKTMKMDRPVPFKKPEWAYTYTREMLSKRSIGEFSHGYWWIEVGGDDKCTIKDGEFIKSELLKYVYGVFDYIKNSGEYPVETVENLAIDWISTIAGKRESRRVYGDYVLREQDIDASKRFEDAVAYGGWTMDNHSVGGIRSTDLDDEGTIWHEVDDIYTIPYRCLYSRNVKNLYVGGRSISASHMAMSSSRVMGTCSVVGQAIGTAVSFALKNNISPREVGEKYIVELQQTLIHDDCYIPGIKTLDEKDLISNSEKEITASSFRKNGNPKNINGDYGRKIDENQNAWISNIIDDDGEWINIKFQKPVKAKELLLRFDPNFGATIFTTQSIMKLRNQVKEMPLELVRDYEVTLSLDGEEIKKIVVEDNFQRVNKYDFDEILTDNINVLVKSNYGDKYARIFEIRMY